MERDNADDLIARIAAVAEPSATVDEIAAVRMHCRSQLDLWKERCRMVDEAMVDHITATGADLLIGQTRYYAGHETVTRCRDKGDTTKALFDACGGDMAAFVECLSSEAFKPGACRNVLQPETFAYCFSTEIRTKLGEAKPKQLMQAWEPNKVMK